MPPDAATLGARATARPWTVRSGADATNGIFWAIEDGQWQIGRQWGEADADLIVYAVNHIEATEARLAEAERLLRRMTDAVGGDDILALEDAQSDAVAFLAAGAEHD